MRRRLVLSCVWAKLEAAADAVRLEGESRFAVCFACDRRAQDPRSEAGPLGRRKRHHPRLFPLDDETAGLVLLPIERDRPMRSAERAIFERVGRKLVNGKRETSGGTFGNLRVAALER